MQREGTEIYVLLRVLFTCPCFWPGCEHPGAGTLYPHGPASKLIDKLLAAYLVPYLETLNQGRKTSHRQPL